MCVKVGIVVCANFRSRSLYCVCVCVFTFFLLILLGVRGGRPAVYPTTLVKNLVGNSEVQLGGSAPCALARRQVDNVKWEVLLLLCVSLGTNCESVAG